MLLLGRVLPITYLASLAIQVAVIIAVVTIVVLLTRQGRRDINGQTESALSDIRESVAASRDETAKALSGLERQLAARIEQLSKVLSERLREDLARQDQQPKTELLAELPAQLQRDLTRLEQRVNELRSATTSGLTTNLERLRAELGGSIRRSQDTLATSIQIIATRLDRIERALIEKTQVPDPKLQPNPKEPSSNSVD